MSKSILIISVIVLYTIITIFTFIFISKNSVIISDILGLFKGDNIVDTILIAIFGPFMVACMIVALIAALLWPIFWAYYIIHKLIKGTSPDFL
jgi:hypothetical protein